MHFATPRKKKLHVEVYSKTSPLLAHLMNTISKFRSIKAIGAKNHILNELKVLAKDVEGSETNLLHVKLRSTLYSTLNGSLSKIALICLILILFSLKQMSLSEGIASIFIFGRAYSHIPNLFRQTLDLNRLHILASRFSQIKHASASRKMTHRRIENQKNVALELDSVDFSYAGQSKFIDRMSLKIQAGKKTAFVGRSGAGKSTLLNLMLGLLEPSNGSISVCSNEPLLDLDKWRSKLGIVLQNEIFLCGTIRQNLCIGIGIERDIKDDEILSILDKVQLLNKVSTLSKGLHESISEDNFSGGELQRLAIARALMRNPDIFVFDEPTSALDYETEKWVRENLSHVLKGKTSLFVAHRLSTVLDADVIHVVEGGQIVESGTHQELLNARGEYWKIYGQGMI
jgi:ABC-type multidrug transport system fused ATPase/permease subunit